MREDPFQGIFQQTSLGNLSFSLAALLETLTTVETLCTEMELVAILVSTAVAVALSILYPRWQRDAEVRAIKKRHGCKDPIKYPHEDKVLGSDMLRLRTEAMKEGRFFKLYESQFEKYGRTFEEIWRGKPLINTTEPANVQQVAALAFEDYGKDPERLKAQSPFYGPSIFSDGPIWKHARGMVKPIFARAEISDIDHLASFADRFMELLPQDGSMIDVQPLLHRLVCKPSTRRYALLLTNHNSSFLTSLWIFYLESL